ncbi:MAG: hypothetical protein IPI84_12690 [Holophagaceae bacterium]|nr:hypothetical protein [Holophagaceae bacterium]
MLPRERTRHWRVLPLGRRFAWPRGAGPAGFDPLYGARPLKRLIQQAVVNPLSRMVLQGQLKPGGLARLVVRDGQLLVEAEAVQ